MTHNFLDPFTLAEIDHRRVRLGADWAAAKPRRRQRRISRFFARMRPVPTHDGNGVPWAEVRVYSESDPAVSGFGR